MQEVWVQMLVKVKLFANFRKNRFKEKEMDLEDNCTVGWVIDYLKIPVKNWE
jgi:hypothetical protein